ncbi:MAG: acyltransferase family protein [Bacteroidaceae bacterium]|nr:acyltransferase family protein [Bacteroidaceae bacterium]
MFRIVAMFLVLVVHADFFSLNVPETSDFLSSPIPSMARVFFQSLSIGCVDMFVLLSGWFGIHPKIKGFTSFIYQCLFFACGIYVVCLTAGLTSFSMSDFFALVVFRPYWFVTAYIGLYVLSPLLNLFVEKATEKQLRWFVICFYTFELFYSWFANSASFFASGYSTMSFIGLYMLARYLHLYPHKLTRMSKRLDLGVFLGIVILQTVVLSGTKVMGLQNVGFRVFSYESPLVIAASVSLLLFFSKLHFRSKMVNVIGKSSFAVYLLHLHPCICTSFFIPLVRQIYGNHDGLVCLSLIFLFLLGGFALAVVIDRIRLWTWNLLSPVLPKWAVFNA